jgi:TolB-like protein/DNA-binding winged helix-turn-helix (wHTH) protein/Flp pilus assembly protein TadD
MLDFVRLLFRMPASASSTERVQFGVFELDLQRAELRKQGVKVKLQEQPLKVLQLLLENPGQIVSREQLRTGIWPANTFVEFDQGLYSVMARLRDALGDSSDSPRFIETVARRGYRFIAPISVINLEPATVPQVLKETSRKPSTTRRIISSLLAGLSGGALLLTIVFFFDVAGAREWLRSRTTPIRSIAVLPLQNLSNDPQQDYFVDGMTDELITELAQIGSLRVISRTSVMYYKNSKETLPQIARELNVDAVLEGSVIRADNRVRITAQLIQVNGDRHIWAKSYERDLRDVLALQSDVARGIVGGVRATLRSSEVSRPVDPEAYEAYLRGRRDFNNATSEADLERSISDFQLAIAKDPQSAFGYSGEAVAYAALADFYRAPKDVMPKAKEAATRALELDEALSEAHDALGWVEFAYEWNWPVAEQHLKRALELNPGNALAHDHYAYYLASLGKGDAPSENQTARELDPLSLTILADSSFYFYMLRQYDRAIEQGRHALELDPKCSTCRTYIALAQVQKGEFKQALDVISPVKFPEAAPIDVATTGSILALSGERERALQVAHEMQAHMKTRYACPYEMGATYTALGDKDAAFKWLQEAYRVHSICVVWLNNEPRFDPLRSDPRFHTLVQQVGLPERRRM